MNKILVKNTIIQLLKNNSYIAFVFMVEYNKAP